MPKINDFEDLIAWQKADVLETTVIQCTKKPEFRKTFKLRDQIADAAGSVCANIAEGFNRGGDKEFKQHLSIAKGSAGEVRSWARSAMKRELVTEDEFNLIAAQSKECERVIQGLMEYLKKSSLKGSKFNTT